MCFNAEVSLSMFILGTLANIGTACYFRKKPMIIALCVFWESIILIQLWEYIMWKNPVNSDTCNLENQWATKAGYMTHLLQPAVLFIALACLPEISTKKKMIGGAMLMMYLTYMVISFAGKPLEPCTGCDPHQCQSLIHAWWKIKVSPVPYILIFGALFAVMVRPMSLAASQIFWAYLTFFIALSTWKNPQQFSSRWCFFAALAPIFMGFTYKYHHHLSFIFHSNPSFPKREGSRDKTFQ